MSTGRQELMREVFFAITAQDAERLLELTDPEVEWQSFFAVGSTGGIYHGHSGIERYVRDLQDAWEMVQAEVEDMLEVEDLALAVGRIHFRGRQSGVENNAPAGWLFKFAAGKVTRFRAFQDPVPAMEAVGLNE